MTQPAIASGSDGLRLTYQPILAAAGPDEEVGDRPGVEEIDPAPPQFGEADSMRWTLLIGGGAQFDDLRNQVSRVGLGVSYFLVDDLSLSLELNGMHFDQRGGNAAGINTTLLMRYHFITDERWTFYFDGGAGIMGTSRSVPLKGSRFNFTPQAGFGFTHVLDADKRFMAGIRWHHVSNARTHLPNPGRDSFLLYAGLTVPF